MTVIDIGIVVFFTLVFLVDRLALLNELADVAEDAIAELPGLGWFHYNYLGDPVTWLQHGIWTLLVGLVDGGLTAVMGGAFAVGLLHGARIGLVMYIVREAYGIVQHYRAGGWKGAFTGEWPRVGWLADAVGDVLGPALVLQLVTWSL